MSVLPQPDQDQTIPRMKVVSQPGQLRPKRGNPAIGVGTLDARVAQADKRRRGHARAPEGDASVPATPPNHPRPYRVVGKGNAVEDMPTRSLPVIMTRGLSYEDLVSRAEAPTRSLPVIVTDAPPRLEFINVSRDLSSEPQRIVVAGPQDNPKKERKKKWVQLTLRAVVTVLLFVFLLKSVSWPTLLAALIHVNHTLLLMGLATGVVCVVFSSYGWRCLVLAEQISMDLARLIDLYLVGIAFSHFLPTSMGGDAVKAFYVGREAGNMVSSTSAVLMSRITSFIGMLLIALPALAIIHAEFTHQVITWFLLLSLLLIATIAGAICAAALLPRISARFLKVMFSKSRVFVTILEIGNTLWASVKRPGALGAAILFGALFWVASFLNYYGYGSALGLNLPLSFYVIAIPIVSIIAALPISINGFGVRESAFVFLFSTAHVPAATALLLALLVDAQVLLFGVIGGCIYLTMGSKTKPSSPGRSTMNNSRYQPQKPPVGKSLSLSALSSYSARIQQVQAERELLEQITTLPLLPAYVPKQAQVAKVMTGPLASSVPAPHPGPTASSSPRRRRKAGVVIGSLAVLLILLGATACGAWWFLLKPATSIANVTLYHVGGLQNVNQDIGGGGIVYSQQQLDISYPEAESVVSVLVKAGDTVSPNQPLIQLDPSQLNAQIKQASDDVASAQAYLDSISASGTAVEIAQAQQSYDMAKNRYNALVAQAASPLLHNGNLISPLSGVVTAVNVNPGQVIQADTPMLTIMDESTVIVHAKIPLANLGQVRPGQQAIVTPSALPDLNLHGTVSEVIPQADPQTDTFEVWVAIPNKGKMLLPGMSAFVRIQTPGKALVVPRLAVLDPDRNPTVFVVRDGHVQLQSVQVVGRSADSIYIGGGLSAGDEIVLVGLDRLQDGQQVHVTRIEEPNP